MKTTKSRICGSENILPRAAMSTTHAKPPIQLTFYQTVPHRNMTPALHLESLRWRQYRAGEKEVEIRFAVRAIGSAGETGVGTARLIG